MKTISYVSAMFAAVLSLGFATTASAVCMEEGQCFDQYTEAYGGGYTFGGGEGYGWGENNGSGNVLDSGSMASSENTFTGGFSFAADSCEGCAENKVTVTGEGFSSQYGGSFIQTEGNSAYAGSKAEGGTIGESGAFSGFLKQ